MCSLQLQHYSYIARSTGTPYHSAPSYSSRAHPPASRSTAGPLRSGMPLASTFTVQEAISPLGISSWLRQRTSASAISSSRLGSSSSVLLTIATCQSHTKTASPSTSSDGTVSSTAPADRTSVPWTVPLRGLWVSGTATSSRSWASFGCGRRATRFDGLAGTVHGNQGRSRSLDLQGRRDRLWTLQSGIRILGGSMPPAGQLALGWPGRLPLQHLT